MREVNTLSLDALLYLIARLKTGIYKTFPRVRGNAPKNRVANHVLDASGFYNYVKKIKGNDIIEKDDSILQMLSGKKHKAESIKKLCSFIQSITKSPTKDIYTIVSEMMSNTRKHAYKSKKTRDHWYLSAFCSTNNTITVTFFDTGLGISQTVKKKWKEKIFLINFLSNTSDNNFITSALKGECRTSTSLGYRGRGLPRIYTYLNKQMVDHFTILSNRGYVSKTEQYELQHQLKGTLYTWRLNYDNENT